ncbi:MAG: hypothetical protein ABIY52_00065 [Gemmatimonadaceae bacterium]
MIRTARLAFALLATISLVTACAANPDPEPELIPEIPVRVAPPVGALAPGDCPEAVRRATAKPDIEVDRLASPKANLGTALQDRAMPAAVRRSKYNDVRVSVIIDTLGKPNMSTFTVVKTTHPWLATKFKSSIAKWTFEPAQLAGCKVPRVWLGVLTSGKPPAAAKT